jgi:hypothetical protein
VETAERFRLPSLVKWPARLVSRKYCLLRERIPIKDSDRSLVLFNLQLAHGSASGEEEDAQFRALMDLMNEEAEKGNYVIAGGDFNQTFPGALDVYPMKDPTLWTPGTLDDSNLPGEGWQFAFDTKTPSCRLLNMPYDPGSPDTQYYVIDGFIVSPNVQVDSVETVDASFEFSDHNTVMLQVTLLPN